MSSSKRTRNGSEKDQGMKKPRGTYIQQHAGSNQVIEHNNIPEKERPGGDQQGDPPSPPGPGDPFPDLMLHSHEGKLIKISDLTKPGNFDERAGCVQPKA